MPGTEDRRNHDCRRANPNQFIGNIGQVLNRLSPGITWFGWQVPLGLSLGIVAVMGLAMLGIAIAEFRKTE